MGLLSTFGAASGRAFGLTRVGAAIKDAYFNLTTLLLPGDGTNGAQNNTFLDSSSNNFTITRNGNTTQGTFTPFSQTGWSNYFSATGDNLRTGTMTALGSGDFTIECWVNPSSFANYRLIWDNRTSDSNTSGLAFGLDANAKVYMFSGTSFILTTTTALSANTWTHVALVRSGSASGNIKIYINGVADATTGTNTVNMSNTLAYLGNDWNGTGAPFVGYISNLRATTGALYTSTFTPSTTPLGTSVSAGTCVLLTCQSNRFVDNSASGVSITPTGASVQAFSPFAPTAAYSAATNGGSGYFDGTGDYLTLGSNLTAISSGQAFTIEMWLYAPSSLSNVNGIGLFGNVSGAVNVTIGSQAANAIAYSKSGTANIINPTGATITVGAWNHVVVCRNTSNASAIFINGSRVGTSTTDNNSFNAASYSIGYNNPNAYTGYMSSLRVVVGTAVYDPTLTTCTVPTAPLTAITNTQLLLNFTNAGITDATAKNVLETVGNAQISTTQSKFGGSSMYFDGTGDWLTVIDNPNLQMGSGDFTIEGWFYLSATGVAYGIVSKGTSTTGWSVNITSGNKLQFSYTSSNLTGATTLSSATWYYFAVVRSGTATGNLKVYLNGSADATSAGAVTDNFNQTNIMYIGADRVGGSALNGYIDDLRITKGFARTITTPTSAFPVQ